MVRINKTGEVYIKMLFWGPAGSGKTTAVDTLYRLSRERNNDEIEPTGTLTKIAMASGSTLYFDRGIFQSKKQRKIFYHVYTVAGQARFSPLRKKIFVGTDGVVFVFDAQRSRLEDNIESLKELKNVAENKLVSVLPLLIMLNKQDLPDTFKKAEVQEILEGEGLYFDNDNPLSQWNPIIYETIALYDQATNIFQVFNELARRTSLYQVLGNGKAPELGQHVSLPKDVPDL